MTVATEMGTDRHIALASEQDIDQMADLLAILFQQDNEFVPDRQKQIQGLKSLVANPDMAKIFLLKDQGRVVAMVSLLFGVSTVLGGRVATLEDMVVAPELRGKGHGSLLLNHVIQWSKEVGIQRITLLTDHDNYRAMKYYEAKGFRRSTMVPFRLIFEG